MKSIYLKEFEEKLKDDRLKVVSIDIFDTLFFRKCGSPTSVFYFVGKHKEVMEIYGDADTFKNYRIEAERLARETHKDHEEITLEEIYAEMGLTETQREKLQQIELETERDLLVINHEMEKYIDLAAEKGKKIILVSDMYLSEKQLEYVCLGKLENRKKISEIYVSSEYRKTKAKGTLFNEILSRENRKPEEMLHLGDNTMADYSMPNNHGISAMLYNCTEIFIPMKNHERVYAKEDDLTGAHIRKYAVMSQPYTDQMEKFYYVFAAQILGPLIYEFNKWLYKLMESRKSRKVHFIMREGWLLRKFFNRQYPEIKTNLLFASRDATLPLLFEENETEKLIESIFRQGFYNIEDFYRKIEIPLTNKMVKEYKERKLNDAWKINVKGKSLYDYIKEDVIKFKKELTNINNEKIKLVMGYMDQTGIEQNDVVVDFGPSGTVFNRLGKIKQFESLELNWVLFYMGGHGYAKQLRNRTQAFLAYNEKSKKHIDRITRVPGLYEIIFNLDIKTTSGYEKKKNKIEPVLSDKNLNKLELEQIKEPILEGINNYIYFAKEYGVEPDMYEKNYLTKMMARVVGYPTTVEVKWFSELNQDEGDGSSEVFKLIRQSELDMALEKGLEKFYLESYINKEKKIWNEGVITKIKARILEDLYDSNADVNLANRYKVDLLIKRIQNKGVKEIAVYGTGDFYRELSIKLKEMNIKIKFLIDLKAEMGSFTVDGHEVMTLDGALKDRNDECIVIASAAYVDDIKQRIETYSRKNAKNFLILSCD